MYQVDLNLLVGVMTFTFSPLHCFYATIVEGGAADRRRRPILVYVDVYVVYWVWRMFGYSRWAESPARIHRVGWWTRETNVHTVSYADRLVNTLTDSLGEQ